MIKPTYPLKAAKITLDLLEHLAKQLGKFHLDERFHLTLPRDGAIELLLILSEVLKTSVIGCNRALRTPNLAKTKRRILEKKLLTITEVLTQLGKLSHV